MSLEIVYPPGCKPVTDNLGTGELIRRLKTLAHTLLAMEQDGDTYQQYIPLALHLAKDTFLLNQNRDVQLYLACCLADVLRVYAPNAPYKDPEQVKSIFLFIIKQLKGLRDPNDPTFKQYFYLLENLAFVKSFNMCFELDDCQEIFCLLFSEMFKIVNGESSIKIKIYILDVLCPLITESDVVSDKLLDIILINIVEPHKSQNKFAFELAKDLVIKCSDTLKPYIEALFNQVLFPGKEDKDMNIKKVYNLIYELNKFCPVSAVLPKLECKLSSNQEQERLQAVDLLARMFSEKDSTLVKYHHSLWTAFLRRFNDISIQIRKKCVQYSMHFLLNHPDIRGIITETLKIRCHDAEENVRYEVVMAIVSTAKRDFKVVSESEELLNCLKERTCDKKFKIRKEALSGLAMIYKKHMHNSDTPQATKKSVTWMKDRVLHGYYMTTMEDRLLVERLLYNSLVPYQLPPKERMKKILYLWSTFDDNAMKAFIELQKHQLYVRKTVGEWVELHKQPDTVENANKIRLKLLIISQYLPEPIKSQQYLARFSANLFEDQNLLRSMEAILRPDISCKDCAHISSLVLKKLGYPAAINLYYNIIKMLLEWISSVMIDNIALKELLNCVKDCLLGGGIIDEIGLDPKTAGEKGLKLLVILSYLFSCHFLHEDIILTLMSFLDFEDKNVAPHILSIFTFVGRYKQLDGMFPKIANELVPICKMFAGTGTPKQAKQAIRCLFVNMPKLHDTVFGEIMEKIKENMNPESPYYQTAIVAIGHIAFNLPDKYPANIKNIVSQNIVKELLMKERELSPIGQPHDRDWCNEDNLPDETRNKLNGLKTMARWLFGSKKDTASAQKTFRMLNSFIITKGDLLQTGKMSKAEMAWMRLTAGCTMLKICEQKGVGDQFSPEQFFELSYLLLDEVPQVREIFLNKLHKGLYRRAPINCLPLEFMGFYALTGLWTNKRMKALACHYMKSDISRRRDYVKIFLDGPSGTQPKLLQQLPNILPDFMLVFAMPVLTHCPSFTSHTNKDQLTLMQACLTHILEPLIADKDTYCFGFYKELIERMKNHQLVTSNDDDNIKMWTLCDLAMNVLITKTVIFELRNFPTQPRIPPMYFKQLAEGSINMNNYLPPEMQVQKSVPLMNLSSLTRTTHKKRQLKSSANQPTDFIVEQASLNRIQQPGMKEVSNEEHEPSLKKSRNAMEDN